MIDKVRALTKTLPTIRTFERFLTCVNPLVADEVRYLTEPLPTVSAFVWFLPAVDALMSKKVPSPGKCFPTSETLIQAFSCDNSFAPNTVWFRIESIVFSVNLLMFDQVRFLTKALPTV